jgi:hypothetical protein
MTWFLCLIEYYSAMNTEILISVTTCKKREIITLSKISLAQKDKSHMISLNTLNIKMLMLLELRVGLWLTASKDYKGGGGMGTEKLVGAPL